MNRDEILELIRAGYTKDEIAALEENKEEKAEEPKPEEEQEKEKEKQPEPDPRLDELLAAVKEMREDLQRRSLMQDEYQVVSPQKKAEEILASVINPFGSNPQK